MSFENAYRLWVLFACGLLGFHCAPLAPGTHRPTCCQVELPAPDTSALKAGSMGATAQNDRAPLVTNREVALSEPNEADLISLKNCELLEELTLSRGKPFSGKEIRHLKSIPRLKVLSFRKAGVTNTGMQELGNLERLQELTLRWRGAAAGRASITDQGLCHLSRMRNLRKLSVFCEGVPAVDGSEWICGLAGLETLETLFLGLSEYIDPTHLTDLSKLGRLRHLSIYDGYAKVTKPGMEAIGRMERLNSIALFRATVGDGELGALASLEELQKLSLVECPNITGSGLVYLECVQSLKSLSLRGSGITDKGVRGLVRFPCLEELDMSYTRIGPGVASLRDLPRLERLVLIGCQQLTADHLLPLAALGDIRSIDVSWSGVELTGELRKAFRHKPLVFAASGWPSL